MQNVMDTFNSKETIKCWVELYSDNMYSWAYYKTSSKETAEDLVQEAFLAAVESFHRFKGDSNPKTWLFAILNNKIRDHYHSSYGNPIIEGRNIPEGLFDENGHWKTEVLQKHWADSTEHLFDNEEFRKILVNCIKELPGTWSSVIHLKFLEDKKGDDVCQELGITNTNLWQILHRAKLQLKKCLEINWFK
jgi:RNA polymerase sigma-70 factor (TIGR02943 family)